MKSDNTENKLDLAPAEAEEGEIPAVAAAFRYAAGGNTQPGVHLCL